MVGSYSYSGRDARGRRRRGRLVAEDRRAAFVKLQHRGIAVRRLRRRLLSDAVAHDLGPIRRRLPLAEVAWVFRNLASLQHNGVKLPSACELLADQKAGTGTGRLLARLQLSLEAGAGVEETFAGEQRELGAVPVSMVAAGVASGSLRATLSDIASL